MDQPVNAVFGRDFDPTPSRPVDPPATEARNGTAIIEALGYTGDRLDLIEHRLGDLNVLIERLGHNLAPVLTDGVGDDVPADPPPFEHGNPEVDRRSTIARNITSLGHRADRLAAIVGHVTNRLIGIDEALELEGIAR